MTARSAFFLLCVLVLEPVALAATATSPIQLTVAKCAEPGTDAAAIDRLLVGLGGRENRMQVVDDRSACGGMAAGTQLPSSRLADLVVYSTTEGKTATAFTVVRIAFRTSEPEIDLAVEGRRFHTGFATKDFALSAQRKSAEEIAGPLVRALSAALLWRRARDLDLQLGDGMSDTTRDLGLTARRLLRDLDQDESTLPAEARVVVKQWRALVLLASGCEESSPAELFKSAAQLMPWSAKARSAAAIARLAESYSPRACARESEKYLFESLALDPWSEDAAANLGALYELSVNARPRTNPEEQVSVSQAEHRLATVWGPRAPNSPLAFEIGVGALMTGGLATASGRLADSRSWEQTVVPGARIELAYGRDGKGFGARLGLSVPWTRQIAIARTDGTGHGIASWTRFTFELGPRYRTRLGSSYGEAMVSLLGAPVFAAGGEGFEERSRDVGFSWGAGGGLRVGRRLGRLSVWLGAAASYYFERDAGGLTADNGGKGKLPRLDLAAVGGLSLYLWR